MNPNDPGPEIKPVRRNGASRVPPKYDPTTDSATEVLAESAERHLPASAYRAPAGRVVVVAYITPLVAMQFIGVPRAAQAMQRIDPMEKEWAGWRIVVSGASVLLVAPPGWKPTIVSGSGDGLSAGFAPYAYAHDWTGPADVRQVFEIPRNSCQIRYYVDAKGGDLTDAELAAAIGERTIAAPSDAAREAFQRAIDEEEAEAEAMRAEAARARTVVIPPKAKPTPAAAASTARPGAKPRVIRGPEPLIPAHARQKRKDDDDDVGLGDEGPAGDESEEF